MYYYGGGSFNSFPSCSCGCGNQWFFPSCGFGWNNNNNNYAIILVLFILLVIVIGARFTR